MCCGAAGLLLLLVSKTEIKKHQMMGIQVTDLSTNLILANFPKICMKMNNIGQKEAHIPYRWRIQDFPDGGGWGEGSNS